MFLNTFREYYKQATNFFQFFHCRFFYFENKFIFLPQVVEVPGSVGQDRTTGPGTVPVNSSPEIRSLAKKKSIISTRKDSHSQVITF
jgi:hypothetical protein